MLAGVKMKPYFGNINYRETLGIFRSVLNFSLWFVWWRLQEVSDFALMVSTGSSGVVDMSIFDIEIHIGK